MNTNGHLGKNDKKNGKKHPPQGDDASTVPTGTCRVGRGQQGESRPASSALRCGCHLDLERLRPKPCPSLPSRLLRRHGHHIYTHIFIVPRFVMLGMLMSNQRWKSCCASSDGKLNNNNTNNKEARSKHSTRNTNTHLVAKNAVLPITARAHARWFRIF